MSLMSNESGDEGSDRVAGVASAIVARNDDPEGLARVKLSLPWREEGFETGWVRIVAPMGGQDRGVLFLPEVGDEVLVAFDRDDIRFPYVLGALWSRTARPPETNPHGNNDVRLIKTRKGHVVKFDDGARGTILIQLNDGKRIEIDDDGILIDDGPNRISLDAKTGSVTIEAMQSLSLKAPRINIEASDTLELKDGAQP